ncbi:MAG: VCBS repeat-containing protein [Ignavibacteria bacterium]|nr:VCBS repeat-containing protein [Ignavibacteria bacterium]
MKNPNKLILFFVLTFTCSLSLKSNPINQFINNVSPPMNANSVVKSSDIVITFAQLMNGSLMNAENIKVFGYQTGLMTASLDYNSVSNTLTINPVNEFKNGEKISVTLTSGLKTISNESITPFVYKFRAKAIGGTGSFTKTSEISNTSGGYIRSGDLDGDGDIDIVINNSFYKNNGSAVFTLSTTLNHYGRPDLFDADNDGDLDIFLSNNGTIYFYLNDGLGNFTYISTFSGSVWAFGDLTGNGYIDIAYFVNNGEVKMLMNTNGIFNPAQSYSLLGLCVNTGDYYDNLLIEDFNNDGSMDVMSISGWISGNSITFYDACRNFNNLSNDGYGNFTVQDAYFHFSSRHGPIIFSMGDSKSFDFNGDGKVDICSPLLQLINAGSGSFSDTGTFNPFINSLDFDFNGDGFIDICAIFIGNLERYQNNGIGEFTLSVENYNYSLSFGSASGDFDGDGDIDMVMKVENDKTAILLNGDSPLPVELSSFTSSVNLNSVKLNWSTSLEQNNSGFEIQRSDNDDAGQEAWKKAGFVNGAGNSSSQNNYTYEDKNLSSGKYKYRLKQIDFNGGYEYFMLTGEAVIGIPSSTELQQNYPNPFNPVTNISYRLSESGFVTLKVFDNSGREVKTLVNEYKEAGYYKAVFDGNGLASGIYFYKLSADNFNQTKKLSLVK